MPMSMEGTKFYWYQAWSARWRDDGIGPVNEALLVDMSEAERETCILTLLNHLRSLRRDHGGRKRHILERTVSDAIEPKIGDDTEARVGEAFGSILCQPSVVPLFMEWPRTLAPHAIVWTVECIRVLGKVRIGGEHQHHYHQRILIFTKALHDIIGERLIRWSPVYQLRILAALLRLKVRTSIPLLKWLLSNDASTEEHVHHRHSRRRYGRCSQRPSLSARSLVQETLTWLASEQPVPFDQAASLGLVALSPWPLARIFLMRAILWAASQVGREERGEEAPFSLSHYILMAEVVEPWKWSWVLISLFNEDEGLLFKMLLMFLDLEERVSGGETSSPSLSLLQAIMVAVNSAQLYADLLERCGGYDVDALLSSMRAADSQIVASYLYRLYRRVLKEMVEHSNEKDTTRPHPWAGAPDGLRGMPITRPTDDHPYNQYALLFTHPQMVQFHWRLLERARGILPDRINHLLYRIVSLSSS